MASGSSVPAWPTRRSPRARRATATTSWLVMPAGLSATTNPWVVAGRRRLTASGRRSRRRRRRRRRRRARRSARAGSSGVSGSGFSRRICSMRWAERIAIVGAEVEDRRLAGADLAGDGRLQAHPALAEGRQHAGVGLFAGEGVEVDDGPVELGVDVDAGDADLLQAVVVDVLQLLGQDLAQQLVRAATCGTRGTATGGGGAAWPASFQPPPLGGERPRPRGATRRSGRPRRSPRRRGRRWTPPRRSRARPAATGRGSRPRRRPRAKRWRAPSTMGVITERFVLQRPGRTGCGDQRRGTRRTRTRTQVAGDLPLLERLDDVAGLEVLEVGEADAALEALADLAGVFLEPLERVIVPFQMMTPSRRKRTFEPRVMTPVGDVAAGDGARPGGCGRSPAPRRRP